MSTCLIGCRVKHKVLKIQGEIVSENFEESAFCISVKLDKFDYLRRDSLKNYEILSYPKKEK